MPSLSGSASLPTGVEAAKTWPQIAMRAASYIWTGTDEGRRSGGDEWACCLHGRKKVVGFPMLALSADDMIIKKRHGKSNSICSHCGSQRGRRMHLAGHWMNDFGWSHHLHPEVPACRLVLRQPRHGHRSQWGQPPNPIRVLLKVTGVGRRMSLLVAWRTGRGLPDAGLACGHDDQEGTFWSLRVMCYHVNANVGKEKRRKETLKYGSIRKEMVANGDTVAQFRRCDVTSGSILCRRSVHHCPTHYCYPQIESPEKSRPFQFVLSSLQFRRT